jgi:hypothetical protein
MGRVPQVDPEQLAALRRLRAAFGPIEILEILDHSDDQEPTQGSLVDDETDDQLAGERGAKSDPA